MCEICKVVDRITTVRSYPKKDISTTPYGDSAYKLLLDFIKNVAFEYRDPPFTLRSGKLSNYYFDCRKVFSSALGFDLAGRVMASMIRRRWPNINAVGGLATGAIPVANAIMAACFRDRGNCLNSFYVFKEFKRHGKTGRIAGMIKEGDSVLIVEDTVTTGHSAGEAIWAVLEIGAIPVGVLTLIDRLEGGGGYLYAKFGLPILPVFTIFNFIEKCFD
jgi:orotate phosphoribosyltransferase